MKWKKWNCMKQNSNWLVKNQKTILQNCAYVNKQLEAKILCRGQHFYLFFINKWKKNKKLFGEKSAIIFSVK